MGAVHRQEGELYCPTCEQTFGVGERCPTDNTRLVRIAAPVDTMVGRDLDGRYTVVEKLGEGGMGSVYRGTQHSVGREVAIKVVAPALVSDATVIKRFLREAKLASRLVHPNAVAVLDFGQTEDGLFYLVMELVAGRTLDAVILEGPLSPARLVRIGSQICDALEGAHALKIVHRDLKPQNVMVMHTGRDLVKVLDFGIAKSLTPDQTSTTMTNAGALLGTPSYMPPELVGGQVIDGRADLYSLGCMMFVAATGKLPFEATTLNELIAMHACEPAPPVTGVPPRLAAVIGRLLEKNPNDRFQTAGETRDALEATLVGDLLESASEPVEDDAAGSSTKLGWSGHHTAQEKGQRQRIATPMAGVRATPPSAAVSRQQPTPPAGAPDVRMSGAEQAAVSRQQPTPVRMSGAEQAAFVSSPTLPLDAFAQITPVPPPPPAKKSRTGLFVALGAAGIAVVGLVTFLAVRSPGATDTPAPGVSDQTPKPPPPAPAPPKPMVAPVAKPEPIAPPVAKPEPVAPPVAKPEPIAPPVAKPEPVAPPVAKPEPIPAKQPPKPAVVDRPVVKPTPKPPVAPKIEKKDEPVRAPITRNPGVM